MTPPLIGDTRRPAPPFPANVEWLNVAAPLTVEDLRGKVVILDFWTYGCINCIHMIPVLEQLEDLYGDALAIISVHSAKFTNEGDINSLRQIVSRYNLDHPVVDDSGFIFWDTYRVNAWPTFVVIDPRGNIAAQQAGEIPFSAFNDYIGSMVNYWQETGEINSAPLPIALEAADQPANALAFPGKVLADAEGGRLFIADTNHHRIVIADLNTYEVLSVIGTGVSGFSDGDYASTTFDKPHGMALVGDILYVADTENHAIREIDLLTQQVRTIAGTGEQSYTRDQHGPPLTVALSSPWDLAYGDGVLFIAMAGPHQIWSLLFGRNEIGPIIGSGREGLLEGSFSEAQLAQPSGITYREQRLYIADSESSAIRAADLTSRTTQTLAGPGANSLFTFGDVDGVVGESRLQHPLGITLGRDGQIYVADTYNSKIKVIDPASLTITTLAGQGSPGGFVDGAFEQAAFDEPGGLSYANGRLYIADTNNHTIRVLDLASQTVSTVQFPNPAALQIGERVTVVGSNRPNEESLLMPAQVVAPGSGEIILQIRLPDGYKINDLAPSQVEWNNATEGIDIPEAQRSMPVQQQEVRLPVTLREGEDALFGLLTVYYCEAVQESLCFIDNVVIEVPVTVTQEAEMHNITVERRITPPDLSGLTG